MLQVFVIRDRNLTQICSLGGCSGPNQEVAGSTHIRSTASIPEQVANVSKSK